MKGLRRWDPLYSTPYGVLVFQRIWRNQCMHFHCVSLIHYETAQIFHQFNVWGWAKGHHKNQRSEQTFSKAGERDEKAHTVHVLAPKRALIMLFGFQKACMLCFCSPKIDQSISQPVGYFNVWFGSPEGRLSHVLAPKEKFGIFWLSLGHLCVF